MKFPTALAALALLAAPALAQDQPMARATLNVQQGGTRAADGTITGGTYKLVPHLDVPDNHVVHDRLIAFEGPGWESDRVAYRLYLDQRNVPDIYGKKLPGRILDKIGQGTDDYHSLADWGMDIFQVDQSLGMGGIGVLRGGKATQLGPARIAVNVKDDGKLAQVKVANRGFAGAEGLADLFTSYRLRAGSRVTEVRARVGGAVPAMVAGLTKHAGVTVLHSAAQGEWRYLASYGVQSLAKDRLGIVLFYRAADVASEGDDGQTLYVRFRDPRTIRYAFAAAWEQEPGAPKDEASFRRWCDETAASMTK